MAKMDAVNLEVTHVKARLVLGSPANRLEMALFQLSLNNYRPIQVVVNRFSLLEALIWLFIPLKVYTIISEKKIVE